MEKGFTLIELLVVIAIIAVLTSIILVRYDTAGKNFALERSANYLAQEIRRVEQMAISGQTIGDPGEEFYPEGGYGIHFQESKEIIIFADLNNNNTYNTPGEEFIKNVFLETDVEIIQLSPKSPLVITFKAPNPNIFIPLSAEEAEITLGIEGVGTKSLKVNKAGLIEIE